jgi:uncharacterized membrane protein
LVRIVPVFFGGGLAQSRQLSITGFDKLAERDRRALTRIAKSIHISRDIDAKFETKLTVGERLADKVAEFGGSWTFIITSDNVEADSTSAL